jgi:hypothetical protein
MTFQTLYAKADDALDNKDLDGALVYHDPDFVEAPPKGDEIDIGEVRYRLSTWLDLAKTVHASTAVVSANVKGVNASAMVKSSLDIVMINPDTKAKAYFVDRVVAKDSWSHRSDGWMLIRTQIISESTTNNGHKVYDKDNPFAPAPAASDSDDGLAPEPAPDQSNGSDTSPSGGSDNF